MISNELLKYTILKTAIYGKFVKTTSKFKIFDLDKVVDVIPTKHFQIKQSEIKKEGKYPVVSQSQSLIEGYSNDYDKVFRPNSSCVIFGDHSKTIKYIDFPFIVGADGTKVIQPKSMLNSKYLYYHLIYNVAQIKSTGYTRNFKYLKKLKLYIPPLEEQEKIVKKIEELFELIDKKEKNDKEKEKLKTLLKEKILDSAIHGKIIENDLSLPAVDVEETKDAVPFDIPNNWKWVNIYNIFTTSSGSFLSEEEKIKEGEYPVYGGNGIISNYINYNVEKDTLVIGRVGYYCGNVKLTLTKSWVNDNALIVKMKIKDYYSKYMLYILNNSDLKNRNSSTAQPVVSYSKIKNILIPIPPLEQQKKIVEKIEECFKLIEQL